MNMTLYSVQLKRDPMHDRERNNRTLIKFQVSETRSVSAKAILHRTVND